MLIEFVLFTIVATASTIFPVYKIRYVFAYIYRIPFIGFVIIMGYGVVVSWLLLNLFSFKSSVAGLGNLMSSIIFTAFIAYVSKTLKDKGVTFKEACQKKLNGSALYMENVELSFSISKDGAISMEVINGDGSSCLMATKDIEQHLSSITGYSESDRELKDEFYNVSVSEDQAVQGY